jgi:hypothetical protein
MRKHTEPTRTRQHGTEVTDPKGAAERIAAFRRIVDRCQYAKIDGVGVDLFSASHVVQVYDALNPENQAKYAGTNALFMIIVAFKLTKKVGGR